MCVRIKDTTSKAVVESNNLWFVCDDFLPTARESIKMNSRMTAIEKKSEEILSKTMECLELVQSNNNQKNKSWSDVVRNKNPPLIIRPKDSSQSSEVTKKIVIENVDPIKIVTKLHRLLRAAFA